MVALIAVFDTFKRFRAKMYEIEDVADDAKAKHVPKVLED